MMHRLPMAVFALSAFFLASPAALALEPHPKYGPTATPLYLNHKYVDAHPGAPDYLPIFLNYRPQNGAKLCSVAAAAAVLGAAREPMQLTADDTLINQQSLLKKVLNPWWEKQLDPRDKNAKGVTLDQFAKILLAADKVKEWKLPEMTVEVTHVTDATAETRAKIRQALIDNEASADDFIVANFIQGKYTGDPDGNVGHLSPVGAFDAENDQVLIFDVDREWYGPYWVSLDTFIDGMNTLDEAAKANRGFVHVIFHR